LRMHAARRIKPFPGPWQATRLLAA
jgi:hypothetical protein